MRVSPAEQLLSYGIFQHFTWLGYISPDCEWPPEQARRLISPRGNTTSHRKMNAIHLAPRFLALISPRTSRTNFSKWLTQSSKSSWAIMIGEFAWLRQRREKNGRFLDVYQNAPSFICLLFCKFKGEIFGSFPSRQFEIECFNFLVATLLTVQTTAEH